MIHKITDVLDLEDDNSSGVGLGAKSYTAAAYNGAGVDLTKYEGGFGWFITCDTVGGSGTIDAKIQDSADNVTFADISTPIAITQITAAGNAFLGARVRQLRRYARIVMTIGVATSVVAAVFIGQKRVL